MRAFAEKIVAAAGPPHSVLLSFNNLSSIDPAAASSIEQELRSELTQRGFLIASAALAESEMDVTLSENMDGYLWIAKARSRAGDQIVIAPVRRPQIPEASTRPAPILRSTLLLQQAEALLDFAQIARPDSLPSLLLLEPERLVLLQRDGEVWTLRGSAAISHSRPWPRDLRGFITASSSGEFKAFLPGIVCTGSSSPEFKMECRDGSTATWPLAENTALSFVSERNYFASSTLVVNRFRFDVPASYSMATNSIDGKLRWIFAGTDGDAHSVDENGVGKSELGRWGDDIASVAPGCGGVHWDVLVTETGDWNERDHLQTFEIAGPNASPVGQPLEISGPVVALWPSDDRRSVRTVSRNLETGTYEASVVSLSCGN